MYQTDILRIWYEPRQETKTSREKSRKALKLLRIVQWVSAASLAL